MEGPSRRCCRPASSNRHRRLRQSSRFRPSRRRSPPRVLRRARRRSPRPQIPATWSAPVTGSARHPPSPWWWSSGRRCRAPAGTRYRGRPEPTICPTGSSTFPATLPVPPAHRWRRDRGGSISGPRGETAIGARRCTWAPSSSNRRPRPHRPRPPPRLPRLRRSRRRSSLPTCPRRPRPPRRSP